MQLNEEEMKKAFSVVSVLQRLGESARREGLLVLDDEIPSITEQIDGNAGEFAQILLKAVVDGIDSSVVKKIAENLISSTELSDFEKVIFQIVLTGCLSMQIGDNPRILVLKCASLTGISGFREIRKWLEIDD